VRSSLPSKRWRCSSAIWDLMPSSWSQRSRSAGWYRVVTGQLRNLSTIVPDSAGPVVEPVDTPTGAIPPEEQESR